MAIKYQSHVELLRRLRSFADMDLVTKGDIITDWPIKIRFPDFTNKSKEVSRSHISKQIKQETESGFNICNSCSDSH